MHIINIIGASNTILITYLLRNISYAQENGPLFTIKCTCTFTNDLFCIYYVWRDRGEQLLLRDLCVPLRNE